MRALCLLALGLPAMAAPHDFVRMVQTDGLGSRHLAVAYSLDVGRKVQSRGVGHRLHAHLGVAEWLSLGLEQSLRQRAPADFTLGVLVPEARLRAGPLIGFGSARLRLTARRGSSWVLGLGLTARRGDLGLLSTLGLERTFAGDEVGLRYQAGVSVAWNERAALAVEGWGTLVWPDASPPAQEHHLGPSVRLQLGKWWLSANVALGVAERRADLATAFQIGVLL